MNEGAKWRSREGHTIFVKMKLLPMHTFPERAMRSPMYLSSIIMRYSQPQSHEGKERVRRVGSKGAQVRTRTSKRAGRCSNACGRRRQIPAASPQRANVGQPARPPPALVWTRECAGLVSCYHHAHTDSLRSPSIFSRLAPNAVLDTVHACPMTLTGAFISGRRYPVGLGAGLRKQVPRISDPPPRCMCAGSEYLVLTLCPR